MKNTNTKQKPKTAEIRAKELFRLVNGKGDNGSEMEFRLINPGIKRGWIKLGRAVLAVENKLAVAQTQSKDERRRHLMVCNIEECAEVIQVVCKCLRFGVYDRNVLEPSGPTNQERLVSESNDLLATMKLLFECGVLPADWHNVTTQSAKCEKVKKFMEYAREKGQL